MIFRLSSYLVIPAVVLMGCAPHYYRVREMPLETTEVEHYRSAASRSNSAFVHIGEEIVEIRNGQFDSLSLIFQGTGKPVGIERITPYQVAIEKQGEVSINTEHYRDLDQLHIYADRLVLDSSNHAQVEFENISEVHLMERNSAKRATMIASRTIGSILGGIIFLVLISFVL